MNAETTIAQEYSETIDEIEDMAKEFDNSVKEDDTNGFEDMDNVDASDLFN